MTRRAALLVWLALVAPAQARETSTGFARATEGDRLEINGLTVRLHGIIAPGIGDPGGPDAQALLQRLVEGRVIACHLVARQRNGLRVAGCEARGQDIGALAVEAGAARDCTTESRGRYRSLERDAPWDSPARRMVMPRECIATGR